MRMTIWVLVGGLLGLNACQKNESSHDDEPAEVGGVDYPAWLLAGSHRTAGVIYGVGAVSGVKNPALARATAENRARAQIAQLLANPERRETLREDGKVYRLTTAQLAGVEIVDHWVHPDGTMYAVAKMQEGGNQ